MDNPWDLKKRLFWKDDPEFNNFNNRLYNELWTFEQATEIAELKKYIFNNNHDEIMKNMKKQWLGHIQKWNRIEKIQETDKTRAFAALTFVFIVLPYDKLDSVGKYFTHFEANMLNVAYFYNTDGDNLPFENMEDLLAGPMFPPSYQYWLDKKYNNAAWWITYIVYEKRNNLSPVIDSQPAKFRQI
jgi:hypothetical protein